MAIERPSEYQRSYPVAPVIPVPGTMVLIDDICRPGNGIECYIPNIPAWHFRRRLGVPPGWRQPAGPRP